MNDKVEIIISEGHKYNDSLEGKGGMPFISVDYDGKLYGAVCPCDNDEEINSAIEHARKIILKEEDIPVIVDQRKKAQLSNWIPETTPEGKVKDDSAHDPKRFGSRQNLQDWFKEAKK